MKRLKLAVIALFTMIMVSTVNAQDENNPWAIGFGINTVDVIHIKTFKPGHFDDLFDTNDWNVLSSISTIYAEKYLDKGFSLQLGGSFNKIKTRDIKDDVDLFYWSVDASVKYDLNRLFGETGWFDPYAHLGGSFASFEDIDGGMLTYGAGFNIWFNDNLGLNIHTGAKDSFTNNKLDHWQHSVGLVFKFGGKDTDGDGIYDKNDECPEVAGLKEFNGCPDTDGDGIKDSEDACPEVAGLASMNGCPDTDGDGIADKDDMCPNEKGTKANKGCPDTDGDGVVNKNDKCPSVAGPSANGGCPWPDTDGDGVLDKDDNCPNEAGVASNNGCEEKSIIDDKLSMLSEYSKGIQFGFDSANINKSSAQKLDQIYSLISTVKDVIFVIEGHTDSIGDKGYNQYLSERRAESAKSYLVKKGMDASRVETVGMGEGSPISSNSTSKGRAQNRRVVIKLNE